MSAVIEQMLKSYKVENIYDCKNAMKEITGRAGARGRRQGKSKENML